MNARLDFQRWMAELELIIIPTYACNLRCAHCSVADHDGWPAMTLEQFVGLLRDARASGVGPIQITGGEFFAWKHHRAALEAIAELGIPTRISTNGTLIEAEHVELLKSAGAELCLSIDGPEPVHDAMRGDGAYSGLAQAAALCRERGVPFDLSCTVSPLQPHLSATLRCAAELGAQAIVFSPERCLSERSWPSTLYVLPDGTVLPQSQHVYRGYALGNAFEQGLGALLAPYWGSAKHQRLQRLRRQLSHPSDHGPMIEKSSRDGHDSQVPMLLSS